LGQHRLILGFALILNYFYRNAALVLVRDGCRTEWT